MSEVLQNGCCCLEHVSKTCNIKCKLKFDSESVTTLAFHLLPVLIALLQQQYASFIGFWIDSFGVKSPEASYSKEWETQDYTISICLFQYTHNKCLLCYLVKQILYLATLVRFFKLITLRKNGKIELNTILKGLEDVLRNTQCLGETSK